MLCAPGTLFDEKDCGCTMRTTFISTLGIRARASESKFIVQLNQCRYLRRV
jgi:hypothetical protein